MTTAIATEIETLITPWIAKKEYINLVIGVIGGGDRWVKGWGTLDSTSSIVDGNTLFEIGSITKVFTSTLLAWLVEEHKLELTTPINRLGKVYERLPDHITLESLATHTSGLPRLPNNCQQAFMEDKQNPYAAYSFDDLHQYLQSHDGIAGKTAGSINYSNLGVGILGNILADSCDQAYEEAIVEHICNPLGLSQTRITLDEQQQARFAVAYSDEGKPTKHWDLPTLAGAGALRSNVNDLLTFLAANLQPDKTPITQAILSTHQLRYQELAKPTGALKWVGNLTKLIQKLRGDSLVSHEMEGVTLGWFVDYLPAINRHIYNFAGGTGGHRSFCGFIKETQTGVVVLSNYSDIVSSMLGKYSTERVGLKILEIVNGK